MNILLCGVVGSTAYGLDTPASDVDELGVFAHDTERTWALEPPRDSIVTTGPDTTYHEARKAVRLMLGCNPTVLEVLWLDRYTVKTPLGAELIGIRSSFLSADRVKAAYLGYATQQFRRLLERADGSFSADTRKRTRKHARHLKRLVDQGYQLYTTGQLHLRLDDPQAYHDFGEQIAACPELARPFMDAAEARFNTARTVLPDEPRPSIAQGWINHVRREFCLGYPAEPVLAT